MIIKYKSTVRQSEYITIIIKNILINVIIEL